MIDAGLWLQETSKIAILQHQLQFRIILQLFILFLLIIITIDICVGKHSSWWSLSATKMYQRGSLIRGRREEAPNFWPQQARGENREQIPQVFGFYVESIIMGYGVSCYHGHCIGQWRGMWLQIFHFIYHKFITKLLSNNYLYVYIYIRESHRIGKISLELWCCLSLTQPLVSLRKTMQAMLQLLWWLVLPPKQRYHLFIHSKWVNSPI